jgi:hypothetical protein
VNVDQHQHEGRPGLKIVCECGNLSIKPIDPASAPDDLAKIYCRRCNAVRGTVADLRELARRSTDAFEF